MDEQPPAGPAPERRDAIGDPGDPQEESERDPARRLPDDRRGEAELRLLMVRRDDVDRADRADHDDPDPIAIEQRAPPDAVRPQSVAARPRALPDITDPARAVTSLFRRRGASGRTDAFGGCGEARSHARDAPILGDRALKGKGGDDG